MLSWVLGEDQARWVGDRLDSAEELASSISQPWDATRNLLVGTVGDVSTWATKSDNDTSKPQAKVRSRSKSKRCTEPVQNTSTPSLLRLRLDALRKHERRGKALIAAGEGDNHWAGVEQLVYKKSAGTFCLWDIVQKRAVKCPKESIFKYDVEVAGRVSYVIVLEPGMEEDIKKVWEIFSKTEEGVKSKPWGAEELVVLEIYDGEPSKFLQKQLKDTEALLHVTLHNSPGARDTALLIGILMASGEHVVECSCEPVIAVGRLGLRLDSVAPRLSRTELLELTLEDTLTV